MRCAASSWRIAHVRREGMIEGLAVDVLGVRRKVCLHRRWQIAVGTVWHGRHLGGAIRASVIEKRPPNISQAAWCCVAKSADADFAGFDPDTSGLFDCDLLFARLCLLRLRQRDGEHAILEICLDFVGVDAVRNSERSLERAIAALGEVIILLLLLLFVPLLALDRQRAVGELDVDIALVHPRQFRRDLVGFLLFDDVDGWGLAPADLAAPERLNVEEATPEWRAPGAQLEVLEQAIDFPPQALERPPLGRTVFSSLPTGSFVAVSAMLLLLTFLMTEYPSNYCQLRRGPARFL